MRKLEIVLGVVIIVAALLVLNTCNKQSPAEAESEQSTISIESGEIQKTHRARSS